MNEGRSNPVTGAIAASKLAPAALIGCALNALLVAMAGWTLAYHLILWLRRPAGLLTLLFPATSLVLGGCWMWLHHRWNCQAVACGGTSEAAGPTARDPIAAWGIVLAVGLGLAACTLLVNRPDSDDIAYFRRAAIQAADPGRPIILDNLTYDLPVRDVVPTQYLVSYELLPAFVGRWTGTDGLSLYNNLFPAGVAICCPIVYYLLCRSLGLQPYLAAAAVLGATLFLVLDGNRHWSPGNFAFVRLWQGKCILITLGLPWLLLLASRFLDRPSPAGWFGLFLAGAAGLGLSATAAFLVPGLLLVVGTAYVLGGSTGASPARRVMRSVFLLAGGAYPVAVAGILHLTHPELGRQIAAVPSPATWWIVAARFGDRWTLLAYGGLLLVAPWLVLQRPHARLICLMTVANLIWFFNPLTGGLLLWILGNVYFRTFYLFPIALCAGLAGAAMVRHAAGSRNLAGRGRLICAAVLWGVFVVQCRPAVAPSNHGGPGPENALELKSPLHYRFPARVREFLSAAGCQLDGRRVLAPWEVAVAVGVTNPQARLLISRDCYSRWSFTVSGLSARFEARRSAQEMVSVANASPEAEAALRQVVGEGADAVVVGPSADLAAVRVALTSAGAQWDEAVRAGGYRLFLRRTSPHQGSIAHLPDGMPARECPARLDNSEVQKALR